MIHKEVISIMKAVQDEVYNILKFKVFREIKSLVLATRGSNLNCNLTFSHDILGYQFKKESVKTMVIMGFDKSMTSVNMCIYYIFKQQEIGEPDIEKN